jgi:hypothetical protein
LATVSTGLLAYVSFETIFHENPAYLLLLILFLSFSALLLHYHRKVQANKDNAGEIIESSILLRLIYGLIGSGLFLFGIFLVLWVLGHVLTGVHFVYTAENLLQALRMFLVGGGALVGGYSLVRIADPRVSKSGSFRLGKPQ